MSKQWENSNTGCAQLTNSPGKCCANSGSQKCCTSEEFAGALGWRLSNDEVDELRSLASAMRSVIGLPMEML
ncbi:hypothetical protein HRI_000244700 [Hibiscus trionum]|uniref:Uncharacterized protein n=1 Tax=Hibiscus trionum TaxID=183268 RepID=A0A9W7GUB0_HIBTR|nr:hypothetical protein HRI_000244700 [Hibiscus trionum]